jgi:hypothetical protein
VSEGFRLPSRAYAGKRSDFTLQVTETAMLNEKTINRDSVSILSHLVSSNECFVEPALNVLDSFFGGGSQVGSSSSLRNE